MRAYEADLRRHVRALQAYAGGTSLALVAVRDGAIGWQRALRRTDRAAAHVVGGREINGRGNATAGVTFYQWKQGRIIGSSASRNEVSDRRDYECGIVPTRSA